MESFRGNRVPLSIFSLASLLRRLSSCGSSVGCSWVLPWLRKLLAVWPSQGPYPCLLPFPLSNWLMCGSAPCQLGSLEHIPYLLRTSVCFSEKWNTPQCAHEMEPSGLTLSRASSWVPGSERTWPCTLRQQPTSGWELTVQNSTGLDTCPTTARMLNGGAWRAL